MRGALDAEIESLVVTEDDYLDFLLNVSREFSTSKRTCEQPLGLPLALRTVIATKPLLFIGYSLTDINFLFILRALTHGMEPHRRVQRVAVQLARHTLPPGDDVRVPALPADAISRSPHASDMPATRRAVGMCLWPWRRSTARPNVWSVEREALARLDGRTSGKLVLRRIDRSRRRRAAVASSERGTAMR